jgi:hypothetical protein
MNQMEYHTNEDLLNGFVDGDLNFKQEEALFEQLSQDGELRACLHDMRSFRSTAHAYALSLTPPASLTKDTFSKLGFAYPAVSLPTSGWTSITTATSDFFRRFWLPVLIGAISLGLISVFTLTRNSGQLPSFAGTEKTEMRSNNNSATHAQTETTIRQGVASKSESVNGSMDLAGAASRTASRSGSVDRAAHTSSAASSTDARPSIRHSVSQAVPSKKNASQTGAINSGSAVLPDARPVASASSSTDLSRMGDVPLRVVPAPGHSEVSPDPFEIPASGYSDRPYFRFILPPDFMVQYRTFSDRSNPGATIQSGSDPWFQNMSIALYYTPWENHWFGLETGQEAFAQHYQGSENGAPVRYEQNLMTGWLAASYQFRFTAFRFGGEWQPFVTADAGATFQFWPILRGTVGVAYRPLRNVALILGADGSFLEYPFQSTWFSTNKVGVTYGLSIQF